MFNKQIKKIIISFSVLNLLLVSIYGALFFFIQNKNSQTTEIYSSMYKQESEKGAFSSTEKSLNDSALERKIIESYFVTPEQAVSFIEQIEKLSGPSGAVVTITSVTPPNKPGENFVLNLDASGKFENIYRLLSLVEEMPYRVTVQSVSLDKMNDKGSFSDQWTGSFTIFLESYLAK